MDWPRYSNAVFAKEQSAARAGKIGIWQGQFEPPWEWRAAHRDELDNSSIVTLLPQAASPALYALGFVLATVFLHGVGIAGSLAGRRAVQVAGAGIATVGLALILAV